MRFTFLTITFFYRTYLPWRGTCEVLEMKLAVNIQIPVDINTPPLFDTRLDHSDELLFSSRHVHGCIEPSRVRRSRSATSLTRDKLDEALGSDRCGLTDRRLIDSSLVADIGAG